MLTYKLSAAAAILLAGLVGVVFAARLEAMPARETVVRYANCFAGGVFLGAGLLHMLHDAQEKFGEAWPWIDYPLVALLAGFGFLVILLIDKVIVTVGEEVGGNKSTVYPYVLMLALSVHSVITGIALGLESHVVTFTAILIAILAHKVTAAMALSLSFGRGGTASPVRRRLTGVFLATTPLGVLLGMAAGGVLSGPGEAIAEGLFDALAAGTFIYIAVVDILIEEFEAARVRMPLFVMTAAGFAFMALLAVWT